MKELIDRGFDPDMKDNAVVTPRMLGENANSLIKEYLGLSSPVPDAKEDGSKSDSDSACYVSPVQPITAASAVDGGGTSATGAGAVGKALLVAQGQGASATVTNVPKSEELPPNPDVSPRSPSASSAQPSFPATQPQQVAPVTPVVSPVPSTQAYSPPTPNAFINSPPMVATPNAFINSPPIVATPNTFINSPPIVPTTPGTAPVSQPSSLSLESAPPFRKLSKDVSEGLPPLPQRMSLQSDPSLPARERLDRSPSVELTPEQSEHEVAG